MNLDQVLKQYSENAEQKKIRLMREVLVLVDHLLWNADGLATSLARTKEAVEAGKLTNASLSSWATERVNELKSGIETLHELFVNTDQSERVVKATERVRKAHPHLWEDPSAQKMREPVMSEEEINKMWEGSDCCTPLPHNFNSKEPQ